MEKANVREDSELSVQASVWESRYKISFARVRTTSRALGVDGFSRFISLGPGGTYYLQINSLQRSASNLVVDPPAH